MKSRQLLRHDGFGQIARDPATNRAGTKARRHLKPTAVIELNLRAIVAESSPAGTYQRCQRFRLLAIDGANLRRPDSHEINEVLSTINTPPGKTHQISSKHVHGLAAVGDEVLQRMVIDSPLGEAHASEVDLAVTPLPAHQPHDLLLRDRGYASYRGLATGVQPPRPVVGRGSAGSVQPARPSLTGSGADSQVVELTPSLSQRLFLARLRLPSVLRVRVVRVALPNGEFAVLVTHWLAEKLFPTSAFSQLYHLRWG